MLAKTPKTPVTMEPRAKLEMVLMSPAEPVAGGQQGEIRGSMEQEYICNIWEWKLTWNANRHISREE